MFSGKNIEYTCGFELVGGFVGRGWMGWDGIYSTQ